MQQLIEAESGRGSTGIKRTWLASDTNRVVLTSTTSGVQISRDNGATAPTNILNQGSPAGGALSGTYPNPSLAPAVIDALVPPGTITAFAGGAVPAGWLVCDGAAVSRTTYVKLFGVISTAYGAGDGSTTFNVPNLVGRVVLGVSGSHALATSGGAETVAAPAHTHPGSHSHTLGTHTHGQNGHTHGLSGHSHDISGHSHSLASHGHDISGHSHSLASHGHDISGHSHSLNGHQHTVNLNHDHALASGVAVASGAITGVHEGPSAVVNVSASNHAHDVDLPALGLTNTTSAASGTTDSGLSSAASTGASSGNTGTSSAASTGGPDTPSTGASSAASTGGGSTDTAGPSNPNTQGPTGGSDADSSAPAASYPVPTIATMMPFLAVNWLIRSG